MQLSAADRRAIIEDLLDIQIFSTMNTVLKDKSSTNKDSISTNKHNIELTTSKYDMQNSHITKLKQNNDDMITEKNREISVVLLQMETVQSVIETLNAEVQHLQAGIVDRDVIEGKIKKLHQFETKIETNLSKHKKDLKFFHDSDNCPTCRQEIHQDFKEQQINTLSGASKQMSDGLEKIATEIADQQNRLNEIIRVSNEIRVRQVSLASNNATIIETNKYITRLQKEIASLSSTKDDLDVENLKLDDLRNKLSALTEEKRALIEEKTYLDAASVLLKDTGIKTKIIKQYLPIINKLVNKYLASLDFFVNFNLDESFKETIKSRHRDEFSYASFSEGEKQRIDMALMLTWRAVAKLKNSTNTNLLILDEVFDSSLDTNGTDYLMTILQMLEDVNLFVISHKGDILQDKFRNLIRFEKVNNFSRIAR
jgi:hypothetical protein